MSFNSNMICEILDVIDSCPIYLNKQICDNTFCRCDWGNHEFLNKLYCSLLECIFEKKNKSLDETVACIEKVFLIMALLEADGNRSFAGRILGLSGSTISKKLDKHKIIYRD